MAYCHSLLVIFGLLLILLICHLSVPKNGTSSPGAPSAFDVAEYHSLQEPYRSFPCLPRRIHLSQATDVNQKSKVSMTVSFSLDYKQCKQVTKQVTPYVYYSTAQKKEKRATALPLQFNYTSSETGEYFESDWIYHVVLPDLLADTLYQYRIEVEKEASMTSPSVARRRRLTQNMANTPDLSFQTPPVPGMPTTIALVGDLGQTVNSTLTMANIYRATLPEVTHHPVSLVAIIGDMSYADSDPHRWTGWFDLMEPLFRQTPLAVAAGNHEIECDKHTHQPFVQYESYFRNPNRMEPADIQPLSPDYIDTLERRSCSTPSVFVGHYNYGNSFYAFEHGLMAMIVLNSYTHSHVGSVQYKWLQHALSKVNRSVTPWLVVSFHSPIYNTFADHVNETQAEEMLQAMEPLFVSHKVNLILSGHCHAYMRTHPLAFDEKVHKGPIYIIVGAGGNREGHAHGYQHPDTPEEWIVKRDDEEFGFGRLHFSNQTHAHWSWIRDGTTREGIRDDTWIVNHAVTF